MSDITEQMDAGLWVPLNYGNRFKACRLLKDRLRTQETSRETYRTLDAARAECDRKNDSV